MEIIKNISLYIIIGFLITGFCWWLDSDFLAKFLHNQIITLSITLVAITSAVRGLILGKITDLSKEYKNLNIQDTFQELKTSLYEQIVMIFLAIFLLIIYGSKKLQLCSNIYGEFITDSLLTSILIYNIYILCDIGRSIIDVYVAIDNKNKSDD